MLKRISVALVAASLIAGPVLAQGTGSAGSTTAPAATNTDNAKPSVAKVKKAKKHSAKTSKKHMSQAKHIKRHVAKSSAKPATTTGAATTAK